MSFGFPTLPGKRHGLSPVSGILSSHPSPLMMVCCGAVSGPQSPSGAPGKLSSARPAVRISNALAVQRASDVHTRTVHDVGVHHSRPHVLVAQQFLNSSDIVAMFQQVRRKGVSKGVTTDWLVDRSRMCRLLDRTLKTVFVNVVATHG